MLEFPAQPTNLEFSKFVETNKQGKNYFTKIFKISELRDTTLIERQYNLYHRTDNYIYNDFIDYKHKNVEELF